MRNKYAYVCVSRKEHRRRYFKKSKVKIRNFARQAASELIAMNYQLDQKLKIFSVDSCRYKAIFHKFYEFWMSTFGVMNFQNKLPISTSNLTLF